MTGLHGARITLDVGPVANGGHCVARHEGQVVFVRHALPGERVVAEVTGAGPGGRFLRADAVEVLAASPDRREAPCPYAGPGGCGGCDWQHATPEAQRRLKGEVVREAMRRQGGVEVDVEVEPVPGDREGLAWRTRATYAIDPQGRAGFYRHHSHEVVPVERCLLVTDAVDGAGVTRERWPGTEAVSVVATSAGEVAVSARPGAGATGASARPGAGATGASARPGAGATGASARPGGSTAPRRLHERVGGIDFVVSPEAFWQVHVGAPETLTRAVIEAVRPQPGEHVVDLYAGAGLFAVTLADHLGPGGRVDAVESEPRACAAARRTAHAMPTMHIHEASVDRWLATAAPKRCDVVVLDPPESGAGKGVLARMVRMGPRAIAYVSCGPASLGRDVAVLAGLGWELQSLRAFDLFPTTHHIECLALFAPSAA